MAPCRHAVLEAIMPEAAQLADREMYAGERGRRGPNFLRPAHERRAGGLRNDFNIMKGKRNMQVSAFAARGGPHMEAVRLSETTKSLLTSYTSAPYVAAGTRPALTIFRALRPPRSPEARSKAASNISSTRDASCVWHDVAWSSSPLNEMVL